MPGVADVRAVHVCLSVNGKGVLFVLLSEDGAINRSGEGHPTDEPLVLCIGRTEEPLFRSLMAHMDDASLARMGSYEASEKKGPPCELAIGFRFASGEEDGFVFRYGAESSGPPGNIARFVMAAVQLTNPWYEKQRWAAR